MNGSVNKVILIGNLGKDPEVRHLENGAVVANFSIATSESYTDKNTGQKVTNTEWHDIVVWRGLATIAEKYLKKGQKVYVEGKLQKRSWQDKDNNTRYTTEIVANELTILSRIEQQKSPNQTSYNTEETPAPPSKIDTIIKDDSSILPF